MNPESSTDPKGRKASSPWRMPLPAWKDVAKRTWRESSKDNVGVVAAGVAFYGFLAMVPLLGASILIYGLAADPQTVVDHARDLTNFLPSDIATLIGEQLINVVTSSKGKKALGLLVAIAIAIWGARNAASAVISALNIAYEEDEKRDFVRVTLLSLAMTLGAVALGLLAGAAVALLATLEELLPGLGAAGVALGKVLTYLFLGGTAAAAAATMFRYAPSRDKARWTWITPGSLFFAAVWIILTAAFGFYVSNFGSYGATYGSLSAVVVLLTWLYLSSYVLLFAAELNSELEHQTARDTTEGEERPLGARGAWAADNVAGEEAGEERASVDPASAPAPQPPSQELPAREHPYLASRMAARAGQWAGLRKVGMIASALATIGLAQLRRRGSETTGALLLVSAAGLSLLHRKR